MASQGHVNEGSLSVLLGGEKEVEIQDYPASSRLFDLLSVRKDLEMSM